LITIAASQRALPVRYFRAAGVFSTGQRVKRISGLRTRCIGSRKRGGGR
jgi:hypothetical protein